MTSPRRQKIKRSNLLRSQGRRWMACGRTVEFTREGPRIRCSLCRRSFLHGGTLRTVERHVREEHRVKGVLVERMHRPVQPRPDMGVAPAVLSVRPESEEELRQRVDSWIERYPADAYAAAVRATVAEVRLRRPAQAEVYASIGRELTRRGWRDEA